MKYMYMNDIEYLIKKRKKILIVLILIPIIAMLININQKVSLLEILNNCMGTNLNFKNSNILEYIMFLFNITIYLFLIIDLYVKDIVYQLDNIFLRISPLKWLLKKNLIFMSMIFIMKLLQYLFLLFLKFILTKSNENDNMVYKLIFSDFLYIIFLQYIFIFIYIVSLLLKKLKLMPYVIFSIIIIILPKSIYGLKNNQLCFLILLILLVLYLLYYLFKYHSKKIIESI